MMVITITIWHNYIEYKSKTLDEQLTEYIELRLKITRWSYKINFLYQPTNMVVC
jgi:hypothetical protein